jgi:hypothetical protein
VVVANDYSVLSTVATVASIVGLLAIAVGAYLRHDAYPGHNTIGKVAEGVGWVGWLATSLLNTQLTADLGVDCNVFGRRCDELANTPNYLWTYIVGPVLLDCLYGAGAHFVGWAVAKVTSRSGAKPAGD